MHSCLRTGYWRNILRKEIKVKVIFLQKLKKKYMYSCLRTGYSRNFDVLFFIYRYMYIVSYSAGINAHTTEGTWHCISPYGSSVSFSYGVARNTISCRIIENEYISPFWVPLGGTHTSRRSSGATQSNSKAKHVKDN